MLWILYVSIIISLILYERIKNRRIYKLAEQIPFANFRKVPILGHALSFRGDCVDIMRHFEKLGRDSLANGGIACVWLGKLNIAVSDPDLAEVVLKTCLEKDDVHKIGRRLLGYGSIFAPVSIWRPRRKVLAPKFALKTLNSYVPIFVKQSQALLESLAEDVDNADTPLFDKVTRYSLDSICETTMGTEVNTQKFPNTPVPKAFVLHCKLVAERSVQPWFHSDTTYKFSKHYQDFESSADVLQDFVRQIIKSKREQLNKEEKIPATDKEGTRIQSLLELLMTSEDGKRFTEVELREESLMLVLAGTDTSSVGISFTALLMAKYPDVQEKVYQEAKEVLGDRPVQKEDLPKLKYLEAVIKESLRLYPPVPITIKKPSDDVKLPNGVTIVPGVAVILHTWALHRYTKYWGADAETFRPERFLENPPTHPYAYIPFGKGPRMCLGAEYAMMSLKTILSTLVRRYRFLPPTAGFGPEEHFITSFEFMLKHVGNFHLQVKLRKPEAD